jgi:hypothetical protein
MCQQLCTCIIQWASNVGIWVQEYGCRNMGAGIWVQEYGHISVEHSMIIARAVLSRTCHAILAQDAQDAVLYILK